MAASLGDSRDRLKDLSLIFTGPYDGRPYERTDFRTAIEDATGEPVSTAVLALGPLTRNHEWYCTLNTTTAKQALLARGTLSVKGKQFRIKSADKRHFTARIHWAPMFVTNADIVESLKFYTPEVKAIRHEMCTAPGFEKVATGVRLVEFVGDRNVLPHFFQVCYPECQESWDLLLTVAGRPPLCLKCKGTGHLRKNCKTPFLSPPPAVRAHQRKLQCRKGEAGQLCEHSEKGGRGYRVATVY
jgi:hypothetical protein